MPENERAGCIGERTRIECSGGSPARPTVETPTTEPDDSHGRTDSEWRGRRSGDARARMLPLMWMAVLASLAVLTGCERKPQTELNLDGIATVDGRAVPAWKLEAELARAGRRGTSPDPQQVVQELIEREQLIARAVRLGLDQDPGVQRSWEAALIAKLKERELEPALKASAAIETKDRLAKAPSAPATPAPELVRLAVLRLEANPKTSAEKLRRLEDRLAEARTRAAALPAGTTGFGALALDYSDDDSTRSRGGDLGWLEADPSKYHFDPQALAAGFALKTPGEMSPVVRGRDGVYLVRLVGKKRAEARPDGGMDEALAEHTQHLERRRSVEAAFLDETRRTIPAVVNTDLVEQVIARVRAADADPAEAGTRLSSLGPGRSN